MIPEKLKRNTVQVRVHPQFRNFIKSEAARREMDLAQFTKNLVEKLQVEKYTKKKAEEKFSFFR